MTVKEAVRDNILRMLYKKEMSVVSLANITGIPKPTLYSIIGGGVDTGVTNAWKIAKGLGITIDDLVSGASEDEEF